MSGTEPPGKDGLLEEAAAWFARMRGPDADESRPEFDKWIARGALHRRAYNRAAEVFAMAKLLAEEEEGAAPRSTSRRREPLLVLGGVAAGILLAVTTGFLVLRGSSPDARDPNIVAANSLSAIADIAQFKTLNTAQSIRLADDSLVRLEPGTSVGVELGRAERRLMLERGTARFYVAHQPRPFIVFAGGGYVVAHGTVFDVALEDHRRVTVGLIEGAVDVSAPAQSNDARTARSHRRLRPGETMSFAAARDSGSGPSPVGAPAGAMSRQTNADAADYSSISLAQLVQLANARTRRPIRIADEATRDLRVSGKFRIDDTDLLAARIAGLFNLSIDRSNPAEIVLGAK